MAAVGDWSGVTLCEHADVAGEYAKVYELTDETVKANQQTDVTAWIAKAQDKIGRLLDGTLKQYYSINVGSYTAAEDLKDHISNPEKLKNACIFKTLELMFKNATIHEGDFNHVRQMENRKDFNEEFTLAVGLLRFDKDDDGDISDDELATSIGSNRMDRV